ncbi:MAG: hypothetical protein K6G03_09480, partial [Lachnospiraceae bacterium]|nr:hypothetical protein [Lachnospiraceae bacterium]
IPEEYQADIRKNLILNYTQNNPFASMNSNEIFSELEEARNSDKRSEGKDFDEALDEISVKYDL